jgi:flagella basal body P-ring formation protein FlgA
MKEHASTFRRFRPGAALAVFAAASLVASPLAAAAIQPLASIRAAAETFIRDQMPPGQGAVVTAGRLDSRLRLARCAGPLQASLLSGERLQANASVAVACRNGADWTLYVPVSVRSRIQVWVLRKPEAQGARLTAADIAPQTRLVSGLSGGYVTNLAVLGRSTLRHALPAGAALHMDDLLADFLVHQGQQVVLLASLGGIRVRAQGVALQAGRYGALIRVQNLSSSKVVQGIVESRTVVDVTP